jgi:hypothetical protein
LKTHMFVYEQKVIYPCQVTFCYRVEIFPLAMGALTHTPRITPP